MINIPFAFISNSERERLAETGCPVKACVGSMSYQDILVFAASQYLKYFTIADVASLTGGSQSRVSQSIKNLISAGFVERYGTLNLKYFFHFSFENAKLFQTPCNHPVPVVRFLTLPDKFMEEVSSHKITGAGLCVYGLMNSDLSWKDTEISNTAFFKNKKKIQTIMLVGSDSGQLTPSGERLANYKSPPQPSCKFPL